MSEYIHIGKIVAPHGIAGHIIIEHALGKLITFKGVDALFVEKNEASFIPYFIQSAAAKTETITHVQIEGITSREATSMLLGKKVWLPQDAFQQLVDKKSPLALLGYMVEEAGKPLGIIQEVIEQPHQLMVTILYQGQEAYIPLHDESLKGVNHKAKTIQVALPDGLLDLYTESPAP
ncbi:MAG: 16S rRNA processing protein RimM [Bacteroidetes bacterium]|jgi:16S rRNA processing protein RimM|nr:16S rRNA processing protein RimM [Bacteroidota bacterium]